MDREGISSPVFDNNDGVNNYTTKASIFDLQRQIQGAQSRLQERIENISAIASRNLENAGGTEQSSGLLAREAEALQAQVNKFVLKEECKR